jgi:hypothetical protein
MNHTLPVSGLPALGQVGGAIELGGGEKGPQDYGYFENKVKCPGPYWGVGQ